MSRIPSIARRRRGWPASPGAAAARPAVLALLALSAGGCASGGSIRELGESEEQMFTALADTLKSNERDVRDVTARLGELGADYTRLEFDLERTVATARLLDAMQAPWTVPSDGFAVTQRAVVLYHFYALERAGERVLEARIRERQARAREMLTAYRRLNGLVSEAAQSLEIVLKHLNQPTDARIRAFTAAFLAEVTAFREELHESDNPRLRELAEEVERYEEAARQATDDAETALQAILRLSE